MQKGHSLVKLSIPLPNFRKKEVSMFKDYNMNQLVLPLDLEVKFENNDIAFHIHHLCAYTQSVFSGRKIEELFTANR